MSDFLKSPDSNIIYTGPANKSFGIETGMPLSEVMDKILRFIALVSGGERQSSVLAEDIIVDGIPGHLLGDYSACWDKVKNKKGRYTVKARGGDSFDFSYDFSDALLGYPSDIQVANVEAIVLVQENGRTATLTNTKKVSNGFILERSNFPVRFSVNIKLQSQLCDALELQKTLVLGSVDMENKGFTFDVVGQGVTVKSKYTQQDHNDIVMAKLNNIINYLEDLKSGDYVARISSIGLEVDQLIEQYSTPKLIQIGTGINRRNITEAEVYAELYGKISALSDRVETAIQSKLNGG